MSMVDEAPITVEVEGLDTPLSFPAGTGQDVIQRVVKDRLMMSRISALPNVESPAVAPGLPSTLPEVTGGFGTRGTFEMVGGMGGAAAGTPFGPVGMAAGGGLGTMAGSLAFDTVEDFLKSVGILHGSRASIPERSQQALESGALDVAFAGGAEFLRPVLLARAGLGKLFGVTDKTAKNLALRARANFGIDLGALDVGNAAPKTLGRVIGLYPITGTPQRKAFVQKAGDVDVAVGKILNDLSPNATLMNDLSLNMVEAAKNTFDEFRIVSGALYDNFRRLAGDASVKEIIPTDSVRQWADDFFELLEQSKIQLTTQERLPRIAARQEIDDYLQKLAKLPERITIQQHRRLTQDLRDLVSSGTFKDVDVRNVVQAKQALEVDLNNLDISQLAPDEGRRILDALESANIFYTKGILRSVPEGLDPALAKRAASKGGKEIFETATAGKFARVDRKIFSAGGEVPGAINEDEVLRVALNLKSARAISDLRKLVGDDLINAAARSKFEDAWTLAQKNIELSGATIKFVDADRFARELGLEGKRGFAELKGLHELFKTAGYNLRDIEEFIGVVRAIQEVDDPRKFVARRVTLGGIKGARALLGLGAATGAGSTAAATAAAGPVGLPVGAVVTTLLARHGAKVWSRPENLKLMTRALSDLSNQAQRNAAVGRLLQNTWQNMSDQEKSIIQGDSPSGLADQVMRTGRKMMGK